MPTMTMRRFFREQWNETPPVYGECVRHGCRSPRARGNPATFDLALCLRHELEAALDDARETVDDLRTEGVADIDW